MAKKTIIAVLSLILALSCIGGTLAFLIDSTDPVQNTFLPSKVDIEIEEDFDGTKKENIKVGNIGDTSAYVRVSLVSYWHDDNNQVVAKDSWFTDEGLNLGENWFKVGDYYYYKFPVKANEMTDNALFTDAVLLNKDTSDATAQVLEVLAEAIQSEPAVAVEEAWPAVKVSTDAATKGQLVKP